MAKKVEELLQEALLLPEGERAGLAARLIDSLDPGADEGVEAAWDEEVRERLRELDEGSVRAVPWHEARRQIMEDADAADES
jgi:putative addiction module component (TIGR02574 family)